MLNVTFEINGRQMTPDKINDAFELQIIEALESDIREKLTGIRDPDTGAFPIVVVRGQTLDNLSFEVEGSPELISRVNNALEFEEEGRDIGELDSKPLSEKKRVLPCVFLSHASEDRILASRIAEDFQAKGIDTFFDEWEIRGGDSLRQKIDAGLGGCTHFVVLITPRSIIKNWVTTEIDAGFVKKVAGGCRFIALRHEYQVEQLPPLLASLNCPSLDNYDHDIKVIIDDIHGITRKPELGKSPRIIQQSSPGASGLSPAAESIAKLMIEQSEHGNSYDPEIDIDEIRNQTGLEDDDILDSVDELEGRGFVKKMVYFGCGPIGFGAILSDTALFVSLDKPFGKGDPEADALRIAADLVNGEPEGVVSEIAKKYGWSPRRMNPAVNYLTERDIIDTIETIGTYPWCFHFVSKNPRTRRFVREKS